MIDPLILARSVHFAATALAGGTVVFMVLVADVAALRARMNAMIWGALAVAIVSGAAWLVLLAADILGSSPSDIRQYLVRWHLHDWQADVHSLGAYSYVPRGAIQASEELSVPVEETLFFAGEHTDTSGHWGTVHAALRSGYRAAAQVLASPSVTKTVAQGCTEKTN